MSKILRQGMEMVNSKPTDPPQAKAKEIQQLSCPCENGDIDEPRSMKKYSYTFSTEPLKTDLQKLLRQVTGETDLPDVTEVKLKVVSGQAGLHRLSEYTPNLATLTLDGSCISSFRDLGSSLKSLMTLSVARCNMRHLDGVWGFRNLRELNARENFISDPSPCSGVEKLSKLDLGDNQVADVSYFAFLRSCEMLEDLRVAGNKFSEYRKEIWKFIPQLRILDGEELDDCRSRSDVAEEDIRCIAKNVNQSSEDGSTASLLTEEFDFEQGMQSTGESCLSCEEYSGDVSRVQKDILLKLTEMNTKMKENEKDREENGEDREENQEACDKMRGSFSSRHNQTDSGIMDESKTPFDVRIHHNSFTEEPKAASKNADKITAQETPPASCRLSYGPVICGNLAISLLKRNPTKNCTSLDVPQTVKNNPEFEHNDRENHEESHESELDLKR